jgi:hypothetical protein
MSGQTSGLCGQRILQWMKERQYKPGARSKK